MDPPVVPYPYQSDEVIGGDSVLSIQRRLLEKYGPFPSFEEIQRTAEDLFEVKVEILRIMSVLDPTGNWMEQGAWILENPRSTSWEHSLESLHGLLERLQLHGIRGTDFLDLQGKMLSRRELNDENSETFTFLRENVAFTKARPPH